MKHNKAYVSAMTAIVIAVVLVVLVVVVPWTLSLVDTTPTGTNHSQFRWEVGSIHTAWQAQQLDFNEDVDIYSLTAYLRWSMSHENDNPCYVNAQIQVGNVVGVSSVIRFKTQEITPATTYTVSMPVSYVQTTSSGGYESLPAGDDYYLAMRMNCVDPDVAVPYLSWSTSAGSIVTEPPGVVDVDDICVDWIYEGLYGHCTAYWHLSFVLEGTLSDDPMQPPVNGTVSQEDDYVPDVVDTTSAGAFDVDWLIIVFIGLVLFVAVIAVVVILKV